MVILFSMGYSNIFLLLICNIIRGFGQGVQQPCVNSFIPEIVEKDKLMKVNGINSSIQALSNIASPALSALLLTYLSITNIFMIDVITAIIGVSLLFLGVKTSQVFKTNEVINNTFTDMKEGLKYIKKHRFVLKFIIFIFFINVMVSPAAMLTPLQVVRNFGKEYWMLSAIEVIFFIGMVLGGLIIAKFKLFKNRINIIVVSLIFFGICTILFGIIHVFVIYLLIMALAGIFVPLFNTPAITIFQEKVDSDIQGRIFSIITMSSTLAIPLGMVVFGSLSELINLDILMIISGAIILVICLFMKFDKDINSIE
jgi:DHA3 family macrolide efflux protein-like MFS transporter